MKKIGIVILGILLSCSLFGCAKKEEVPQVEIVDDNYRNVYEIFVASFADSDGDHIGDINGVISKLDYIQRMGYTAIWFMPIHPSPSYHKYDVTDYYDIDKSYGTLEDFDRLIEEAHKRNIHIIIDLVINHTSSNHPWFVKAKQAFRNGTDSEYLDWYNFTTEAKSGYTRITDGKYYEARFVDTMPDLNLDNQEVRDEITKICQFWIDHGVDGFRLDAVTSYYTGDNAANTAFLSWINRMIKGIKEDAYIVGEAWTDDTTIGGYYTSGVDSFFHFSMAQADGTICRALKGSTPATTLKNALENALKLSNGHIPAMFLDNHDVNRITGGIGRSELKKLKFAYGMLSLFNGCTYTYYGTEIGMVGSGRDENKRIAMLWNSDKMDELCANPKNTSAAEYVYPGVEQQDADEDSLLNYHKLMNFYRNRHPEIARGEMTFYPSLQTAKQLVVKKTWNEKSVIIIVNLDGENRASVSVSEFEQIYPKIDAAMVNFTDEINVKDGVMDLPPYAIAILYAE
ncbi:MAG: hypothetical protein IKE59_07605 [Erysipelotrichaceae bacterium]|nr:hypothetical protein [Erysipelotrichaceae bacterium]